MVSSSELRGLQGSYQEMCGYDGTIYIYIYIGNNGKVRSYRVSAILVFFNVAWLRW